MKMQMSVGVLSLVALVATSANAVVNDADINPHDFTVYLPSSTNQVNEHFNVVRNHRTGNLVAFWTQETHEGSSDMHVMFSRSSDGGKTWLPGRLLWGSPAIDSGIPNAMWALPMVSKSGRLYVVWNQHAKPGKGQGVGQMAGAVSDDDGETWTSPVKLMDEKLWCPWQRPLRMTKDGKFLAPVSFANDEMTKTCFIRFENVDEDPEVKDLKFTFLGESNAVEGEEAALVRLPDGRLFAVMRSRFGWPLWIVSKDDGETWSNPRPLRDSTGTVIRHPRAPCPIYDLGGDGAATGKCFGLFMDRYDPELWQWEGRDKLYRYDGEFDPKADQPVRFTKGVLLMPRDGSTHYGNSCYSSYTYFDGKGILWYPDNKRYLYGLIMTPDSAIRYDRRAR